MFEINVIGFILLTKSVTYIMTVGNKAAKDSVIIFPEALHVNTSICPGVSIIMYW